MKKPRMRFMVGGIAVATAAAVAVPGWATGAAGRAAQTETFNTIMKTVAFTAVDADHNGKASIGDYSVAQVVHIDPKTGKRVGTGVGICTQVTAAGTLFDCQGSDVFAAGELREGGRFTLGKTWQLSILGGSGKFDGASGSVDGTWLDAKATRSRDVFAVTL